MTGWLLMDSDDRTEIATEVLAVLSQTVLQLGPLLDRAYSKEKDFDGWVLESLPLQPHTAERIRAMWHLWQFRPNDPELPEAWKALWSLD